MKDYDDAVLRYEGFLDGAQDKAREMARDMLAENLPLDLVVRISKLSESEILSIKASLEQKRWIISPRNMSNSWMKDYDDAVLRYEGFLDGAQDKAHMKVSLFLQEL